MNIAVNTRLLIRNKLEGIGWFTFETLKRITNQHPEHHFYFIFDRHYDKSFIFSSNITPVVVWPPARHPLLFYIWFEWSLPGVLKKINPDLFLSPDGYLSLRSSVKSLAVFHDLNFEHYPDDVPFFPRKHYRYFFPRYAQKAERIATVSGFSKKDIMEQYGIPGEKIDVVYDGANENFNPIGKEEAAAVRGKYTGNSPYIVFVGSLHPRKNLINLFKGFDIFREKYNSDIKLLVVGARMWWTPEIEKAFSSMKYQSEVIFSGRLNSSELGKVIAGALALAYVSYFEGFGIPIVEAFRCDVPVITSNVTSMPEIAGDAALLVDPFSPESISEAMFEVATKPELREELIRKGRARKDEFTWQKTADRLWESMMKAIDKK